MIMRRIVITGGPRTGKTTIAEEMALAGVPLDPTFRSHSGPLTVRHTDDLIGVGWSEASAAVALWFDAPGPWIVEGVAAVRALRKWLAANPDGKPCDVVYWLSEPVVERTPGQISMANGCDTVWRGIVEDLRARGVDIRDRPPAEIAG